MIDITFYIKDDTNALLYVDKLVNCQSNPFIVGEKVSFTITPTLKRMVSHNVKESILKDLNRRRKLYNGKTFIIKEKLSTNISVLGIEKSTVNIEYLIEQC